MIDLLATLVIYQLANCLEYKAACPSQITQTKDCSVGHVIFVTWARGICLICMSEARGPQARGLRAYISGKSRVHMLQVICNTSGTLKICPNLMSLFPPLYIVTGTRCDCGTLFHRCHDVLAW